MLFTSRVERWRGGVGFAYLFPALSSAGASLALPYSVSISRIRLSDKDSWVRPRNVAIAQSESDESELMMQVIVGVA